jgi:hypothetical protein
MQTRAGKLTWGEVVGGDGQVVLAAKNLCRVLNTLGLGFFRHAGGGGGGGGERETARMPAGDGDGARGASVAGGSVGGDKGDGVGEDGWHSKRLWASYKQLVRDVRAIYYYLRYVHDLELAQNPQIPCGDLAGLRPNSMTNGFFNIYVYMFIIYILLLFYYYFREKVKRESLGRLCEALEASI